MQLTGLKTLYDDVRGAWDEQHLPRLRYWQSCLSSGKADTLHFICTQIGRGIDGHLHGTLTVLQRWGVSMHPAGVMFNWALP
jgi:hypothetical protein